MVFWEEPVCVRGRCKEENFKTKRKYNNKLYLDVQVFSVNENLMLKEIAAGYATNGHKIIIACIDRNTLKTFFADWEWLNLGLRVSEQLCSLPKELRKESIADIVSKVVNDTAADNVIIENIDLLFAPEYSLDVLKLLTLAGKNKRLVVLWEGSFKDGVVTYAEPGCEDYHRYEIKNYDACCIAK